MTPTLLFLPGTWCDERVWAPCAVLLDARWRGLHVDYRDQDSIAAMAARGLAAVDGPVVPVGLSMGGIVALAMWRQAPQRLAGLALFGTNPGPDTPERAARRAVQLRRAQDGEIDRIVAEDLAPAYFAAQPPPRAQVEIVAAMARDGGAAGFAAQSAALATRPDAWPDLAGIDLPVLLACGEHDPICPPDLHARMAGQLARPTLSPIRQAGHLAPLEQPALAALALQSWLRLCFAPDAGPAHHHS